MRQFLEVLLTLTLLYGCSLIPKDSAPSNSLNGCPEQSKGILTSANVESINLSSQVTKKSGQVKAAEDRGYLFQAKADQSLKYKIDEGCLTVYMPNNQLLHSKDYSKLPASGKYTVQVFVPSGSATFNLELSLVEQNQTTASSSGTNLSSTPSSIGSTRTSTSPYISSLRTNTFTQDQALKILQEWLDAKKTVFASPYDRQPISRLTMGKRYKELIGAVDWLEKNNAYWRYPTGGTAQSAENLVVSGNTATATVNITEETEYYQNGKLQKRNNWRTITYMVQFQLESGIWKIASMTEE